MIHEAELLRLIDKQLEVDRTTEVQDERHGEYRSGCRATLTWVREQIGRMEVPAGKHVTWETYTRAQIAALATAVEAIGRSPWVTANEEVQAALAALRRVIPEESAGG